MTDVPRLTFAQLPHLPKNVVRPRYGRANITRSVVHLGVGAFHRAHQAVYLDDLLQQGHHEWGMIGVSLRRSDMRDALASQDYLYTLITRNGQSDGARVIGSMMTILVAPENPAAVIAALAATETRIVSLTITEKGYCHEPATATLDENHPDIRHDIDNLDCPKSAIGFIVAAIRKRYAAKRPPFTLLSCDNLPANGATLKRIILRFAELAAPELVDYISDNIAFPSTMVDRIVPATTDADKLLSNDLLAHEDAWPVVSEPFSQWVVEDDFSSSRPPLEKVGVQFVGDVAPFELMKLRLLNGAHSTLAYLGYLAGFEYVADVMATPHFARFIRAMMDEEVTPTLRPLPDFDLDSYKDDLIARFKNPALKHRTWQIAMDGSQKIPQRLLGTIRARLQQGQGIDRLVLGLAGWMRYATGIDEKGGIIDVRDPQIELIQSRTTGKTSIDDLLDAYLAMGGIFGDDLPHHTVFKTALHQALEYLFKYGAERCVHVMAEHHKLF